MKTKNIYELDPERLATTDAEGHRVYLYPEDVHGKWKNRRTLIYWALILVYLVLPWFYVNGKPALMIDLAHREFTFFGNTLHGMEPVIFFLLFASGLFFVAFATSVFGRLWCGWACPQTVFIQTIFLKLEEWIEGRARERRALDQGPLTSAKFFKKALKWSIYTALSLHIAHTFMGYFLGPRELFEITLHSPAENPGTFTAVMIITTVILLDFGWFREQFCIIACPYGRIQSVLMDDNSLVVAYDAKRGEPRRGTATNEGDCINCYNCVKVCPTGIDIRRGTQLECIACTNCIDACDEIMRKIKKPEGLVRYSSERELEGKKRLFPFRGLLYLMISAALLAGFGFALRSSTDVKLVFIRGKVPYTITGTGQIANQFQVKIVHQGENNSIGELRAKVLPETSDVELVTPVHHIRLDKAEVKVPVFIKFAKDKLVSGSRRLEVELVDEGTHRVIATKEVVLVGPN